MIVRQFAKIKIKIEIKMKSKQGLLEQVSRLRKREAQR